MDDLVNWLAPYLARFELPDQSRGSSQPSACAERHLRARLHRVATEPGAGHGGSWPEPRPGVGFSGNTTGKWSHNAKVPISPSRGNACF